MNKIRIFMSLMCLSFCLLGFAVAGNAKTAPVLDEGPGCEFIQCVTLPGGVEAVQYSCPGYGIWRLYYPN